MNFPTRQLEITRDVISLRRVHRLINPIKQRSLITREFFIQQISCSKRRPVEQATVIVHEKTPFKKKKLGLSSVILSYIPVSKIRIVNGVQFISRRR